MGVGTIAIRTIRMESCYWASSREEERKIVELFPPSRKPMKHPIRWALAIAPWILVALGWYWSFRCLPPINEPPLWLPSGQEQNWIGQGGWAFAGYSLLLLVVAYCIKRVVLTHCSRRGTAAYFFSLFILLSLPYVWFLCEPDWLNCFVFRVSCWVGGPIGVFFVPTVSFLVDFCNWNTPKPLGRYLIRSGIEILVAVPIWVVSWTYFSFFILQWGWI